MNPLSNPEPSIARKTSYMTLRKFPSPQGPHLPSCFLASIYSSCFIGCVSIIDAIKIPSLSVCFSAPHNSLDVLVCQWWERAGFQPWFCWQDLTSFFPHLSLMGRVSLVKSLGLVSKIMSCSVQFSWVAQLCLTLRCHEAQHPRPPCPSPTPGVHPNPCPLSQWCLPTVSSSVIPFSSCPQSFPASGSFQMSQLFASGGQSIMSWG